VSHPKYNRSRRGRCIVTMNAVSAKMKQHNSCILECPDNASIYHNASSYTTPSPLYSSVPLYFNSSTAVSFECMFVTRYLSTTMYAWYVDGVDMNAMSKYFTYYFADGVHQVTCAAWYQLPDCEPCNRTVPVTVYIDGKMTCFSSFNGASASWPLSVSIF